jgi:hypothetical protein
MKTLFLTILLAAYAITAHAGISTAKVEKLAEDYALDWTDANPHIHLSLDQLRDIGLTRALKINLHGDNITVFARDFAAEVLHLQRDDIGTIYDKD